VDWLTATINDLHSAASEPEDVEFGSETKRLQEVDVISRGTTVSAAPCNPAAPELPND
jgi:hypothetical protein